MEKRGTIRTVSDEGQVKVPPHDLYAERSVLGAILVNQSAMERVRDILSFEDFYSETHRVIYQAAVSVMERGEPVDQITVSEELVRRDQYDRVGGRATVFRLIESVPVSHNAHRYAEIVRGKSVLRNLIDAGARISEDAFREPEDISQTVDRAEQIIYEIASSGASGSAAQEGASSMSTLAAAALEEMQRKYETGESGLSTGFEDLDGIALGSLPGDLIILAARPAMGKTAMLLSMVARAAEEPDSAALIFSLEMSKEQLTNRAISHKSHIPITAITDPSRRLAAEEWPKVLRSVGEVSEMQILVDDQAEQTISKMRSRVRREASRLAARGKKLSLVAVDYLQLMVGDRSRNSESRTSEVGDISRGLKVIAREFGVPVIALSQLSRKVEERKDKRPMLSDLRESGSIEQDADKVMFLYRDEYYDESTDDKGIAEVIVAKHRNGPTGTARLAWIERYAEFASLARRDVT